MCFSGLPARQKGGSDGYCQLREPFTQEANQITEDQIGLDRGLRREVQRRLNGLGFDTNVTGKFDEETRAVITRWQAARGYPTSGFLNKLQHQALLGEIVATRQTTSSEIPSRHLAAVVVVAAGVAAVNIAPRRARWAHRGHDGRFARRAQVTRELGMCAGACVGLMPSMSGLSP